MHINQNVQHPLPTLPLYLSHVAAGFPSPADDYIERRLDLQEYLVSHPAATFYLKAGADCPAAGVRAGDMLVIDRSLKPTPGRVAVVVLEGSLKVAILPKAAESLEVWGVVKFIIHPTAGQTGEPWHVRAD
jgi:DNA polymerase V